MLLAIDVGNTQTHVGVLSKEGLAAEWRTFTEPRRSADELAAEFHQFLSWQDLSFSRQVTGVAISSVVPAVTSALREMVERYFHFIPVVVEPGIRTGMPILIENPSELGADRLCNAVAAWSLGKGGPMIVIDFGTATTFDALSRKGEYLGGAIVPGIQISADALAAHAARIPVVELVPPRSVVGKSTVESVRSGVILGAAAMVEGMVERIRVVLESGPGPEAEIVATGGLAPLVLEHCAVHASFEPALTLEGLRILYDRNVQQP
ncbi:MAG: type III pantothenate kinase [Actinomycetota bacterium]|nr:type III pantothenate kinase [Actinomycetota bacterium]